MKDIKDYLHLYKYIMCIGENGEEYKVIGMEENMALIIHSATGGFFKTYANNLKPMLRPLSSITEDEKNEIGFAAYQVLRKDEFDNIKMPPREMSSMWAARQTAFLLSKHFDLFGLIDAGLAIAN